MKIAIIPARGGSKRIKRKNIKEFNGNPILINTIRIVQQSGLFDEILVSTEDKQINDIALVAKANTLHRPNWLADDNANTAEVIIHALNWFSQVALKEFEFACCIYPVNPFLTIDNLKRSFKILNDNETCDSVFPVTTYDYPIMRAMKIKNKNISMVWEKYMFTRSQDFPEYYHDVGQFYWIRSNLFLHHGKLFGKNGMALIIPRYLCQDIDTLEDWKMAEVKYRILKEKGYV